MTDSESLTRRLIDEKEDHLAKSSYFEFAGLAGLLLVATAGGMTAVTQYADRQPISGTIVGAITGLVSYGILRITNAITQDIMNDYAVLEAKIRAEYESC